MVLTNLIDSKSKNIFQPTLILENGYWHQINEKLDNWFDKPEWSKNVEYATIVAEDIAVVYYKQATLGVYSTDEFGVYKGTFRF